MRFSPLTPIERLKPGDEVRTFRSAAVANECIDRLNLLSRMIGKDGIKVTYSDSNIVISGHASFTGSTAPTTTPTPTTGSSDPYVFPWKGQWQAGTDYVQGDIVRRNLPTEYDAGNVVGTYIALRDCPVGCPDPNMEGNAFWDVFAPFATTHFVMVNAYSNRLTLSTRVHDGNTAYILIEKTSTDPETPEIVLDILDAREKKVRIDVVDTCEEDPDTGVQGPTQRLFLRSTETL